MNLGLEILSVTPNWPVEVLEGIAQHHERMNGSGYPRGLEAEKIGIFGRMAGIGDCFAALTKSRPYAEAVSSYEALRSITGWGGDYFHAPLTEQFVQAIGVFPVGSLVELSTGEVAVVVSHNKVRRLKPRVLLLTSPDKTPSAYPIMVDLLYDPLLGRRGAGFHPAQPPDRRLRAQPARELPIRDSPAPPADHGLRAAPSGDGAREDLLRFLGPRGGRRAGDQGAHGGAPRRSCAGSTACRRCSRGRRPAITLSLVIERLRPALRPEDRLAALSDEQVCIVLPRIAHPTQAVLAAVKCLRALDRPIAHEGGTAVLRPCVGIATVPEHNADPARLLMAADVARRIAGTREEGYHVFQSEDSVEAEVYHGLDIDLQRAIRSNELEVHYQPQITLDDGRAVAAEALLRWRPSEFGPHPPHHHRRHRREHRDHRLPHVLGPERGAAERRPPRQGGHHAALQREPLHRARWSTTSCPDIVEQALGTWGVPPERITPRDHRKLHDRGRGADHGDAHATEGHRRAAFHRRFRHRLLVARLPQALPRGRAEDRQALRERAPHGPRRPPDRALGDRPGAQLRSARRRRGRRGGGNARGARAHGVRPRAGLPRRRGPLPEREFRSWWTAREKAG
ncbi:MAG: diguanylate cyclase [Comamonadaceae bacterium]|nr:diguanylate cyclase [Comamonadaceae bacterium]